MTAKQILLHKLHKRLWLWLARNPGAYKWGWPGWTRKYKDEAEQKLVWSAAGSNRCFACAAAAGADRGFFSPTWCERCPLDWPVAVMPGSHQCIASIYGKWMGDNTPAQMSRYARAIANLPWTPKRARKA